MNDHTDRAFDTDMSGMRQAVVVMGELAQQQFARAVQAVRNADLRLAAQVVDDERVLNRLHLQVDLLCNQIIARRQPIAIDLREVIGAIHINNDLERIGDEAKKIALRARKLAAGVLRDPKARAGSMADQVASMLAMAIDAFVRHDTSAARRLNDLDRAVDASRDALIGELVAGMAADSATPGQSVDLILVVQSIERVGDHAENIAEYVVNVVEGIDMRHGNVPRG
jgi:phosphate transport system protein